MMTSASSETTTPPLCGVDLSTYYQKGYPDLQLLEPIVISRQRGVYRAVSKKHGKCIVKTTCSAPSQLDVDRLRHEFNKLKMCSTDNVVKAYDIYNHQSSLGVAILTEECGPSLRSWIDSSTEPPSLEEVLNVGIRIAQGLDHLHRHARLIHSDINPTSICYSGNNKVVIVSLGSAHGFVEPFTIYTPEYQSPEQARGLVVDHRSDLYSLGVLLFYLYTQHFPIHACLQKDYRLAHMMDIPRKVSEFRPCPAMFDAIVARLLVKSPDDRYLTAAGLLHDLRLLLKQTKNNADNKEVFELGTREVPFVLMIPNTLIGRSNELAKLNELYRTSEENPGKGGFCYLEGKPGVGKTALIQTFQRQKHNPFFFSYKFNQYGDCPMRATIQFMSSLVIQIVASEQFSDESRRKQFLSRLGACDVLRALVDVVPAFTKLLPKTQPTPQGLTGDVRKSLYPAMAHVLRETRKFIGPIVAFFDDIQWIDPGSKGVLSSLLAENVPLLIIVAFRDATSQSTFALESLFHEQEPSTTKPMGLVLHELSEGNVGDLINSLALSQQDKKTLGKTMFEQTEGNPFFLRFRLAMMAETGALVYDVDSRLWKLVKDRIDLGGAVTATDAVEYCVTALRALDHEVSCVLCRLAMMPQGLTLDEYASILEHEHGVVALAESKSCTVADLVRDAVTLAVQKSLLCHRGMGFSFTHDRIQQGAGQLASEQEASRVHYYLGKQALPAGRCKTEQACEVLDHFSKSRELITDPDLILRIGELMQDICSFYITAGSHEQLDGWLEFVRELLKGLNKSKIQSYASKLSALEVRLLIAHHEIKFLMNDLEAAESLFDCVRPRLKTPAEVRDAYHTRISLLINSASHHEAVAATAEALALLDEHSLPRDLVLPEGQPAQLVGEVTKQIKDIFAKNPGFDVAQVANSFTLSSDEDHSFRLEIMVSIIPSMYLLGRYDLYMYVPSMACRSILKNGVTPASAHAFSVLGFALVAVFKDSFGAQVAMIGKQLADRFDNHVTTCLAYCMTGVAVPYNERFQNMASRLLYASYVAGRTAHDPLWACYAIYVLTGILMFEGVPLPEIYGTLEDLYEYAMSDGHQALALWGLRSTRHTASILMHGNSTEEPVFHFSVPPDEITKSEPLIGITHGSTAAVALFFQGKLEIAWQLISEILARGLDKLAPGLGVFYIFHIYSVVVAHGLLIKDATSSRGNHGGDESLPRLSEDEREKLKEVMRSSSKVLEGLNGMAPAFTPYNRLARACIIDMIESRPLDALPVLESVVSCVQNERPGKHHDIVAISHLISADICRRTNLNSIQSVYATKALEALETWGANSVIERISRELEISATLNTQNNIAAPPSAGLTLSGGSDSVSPDSASNTVSFRSNSWIGSGSKQRTEMGADLSSILRSASYITSFSSFDELTEKLSSTLLQEATASRLLLLMRDPKTGNLEPTAEATLSGASAPDTLLDAKYSTRIVKITDEMKEQVVVHSAQQESPHCFDPYIQQSKVASIATLPIIYQDSLVAVVYIEHEFRQGVFKPQKMEALALLGQHVASAIANARLLRDVRRRTAQLEQSHAFLAKALRVKDTVLSRTSHELRSPLSGIIGLNEFYIEGNFDVNEEVMNCMKTTLAMARQLLSLVSDILDMSCIDEGGFRLNYETASLHALVNEVFNVVKFTSNSVRLVNTVSESFPEIMVDPVRFKQVIFNLTSNAIKFTPEGSVTISCELLDDKKLIMMTVRDTGIGIDQEHLDVIFEPFGQVELYETQQHQGAGLGLSITKKLVEQHGGRIDVLSTVGEGSTFQVFIPMTPPDLPSQISGDSRSLQPAVERISPPSLANDSSDDTPGQQTNGDSAVAKKNRLLQGEVRVLVNDADVDAKGIRQWDQLTNGNGNGKPAKRPKLQHGGDENFVAKSSTSNPNGDRLLDQPNKRHLQLAKKHELLLDRVEKVANGDALNAERVLVRESDQLVKSNVEPVKEVDTDRLEDSIDQDPLRVLAVDDTPVNLKVLTNFLRKAEMEVSTATNGQVLLKRLAGDQWKHYDVVLLDWMMPVMDGITACRLLRQRIPNDLLPVIFLTAKTAPADVAKGFAAGGTDFATKPFNRYEVVARTLSQGRASRRARARYFEGIPNACSILTKDPFWKMQSATDQAPMFVICLHSLTNVPFSLGGSLLLKNFRLESTTFNSHWSFCEVGRHSVCFLAARTSVKEMKAFLRLVLAGWAASQVGIRSESSQKASKMEDGSRKPLITIGVDYREIRAHLFAEKQPMLAAVESCTSFAKALARKGTMHEEIVMSDIAKAELAS